MDGLRPATRAILSGNNGSCKELLDRHTPRCEQLKSWWNVCTQSAKMGCSEKMHFALEVGHGVNHSFSFVGRTGSGSAGVGSADSRADRRRGRADGSAPG